MLGAILAMALVLDSRTSPDPASLVGQLGSSRYAARVAAEGELARLGRAALPALRAGKESRDAEIRARSIALVARIEDSSLLQATPIHLDLRDARLIDAIGAINKQAGPGLALSPEELPTLAGRRISLRSDEPLPFWTAIDALCAAANVRLARDGETSRAGLEGSMRLQDGPNLGVAPVSDSGPFRVRLASLHRQSEILLDQGPPSPAVGGSRPISDPSRAARASGPAANSPCDSSSRPSPGSRSPGTARSRSGRRPTTRGGRSRTPRCRGASSTSRGISASAPRRHSGSDSTSTSPIPGPGRSRS